MVPGREKLRRTVGSIGGGVSKFKEADSHAHNASLLHLLQYYKSKMPNLRRIIMCTDGCGGQYKGRFNFKYIARYTRHEGISVRHIFAATAHFKGFHGALGKLIAKIYEKAEKYHKARSETSYELKKLVAETIQGEVETVGSGEMAINQYFVRYLTSVENDPRIAESETIYVKRPVDWDTNSLEAVSGRVNLLVCTRLLSLAHAHSLALTRATRNDEYRSMTWSALIVVTRTSRSRVTSASR